MFLTGSFMVNYLAAAGFASDLTAAAGGFGSVLTGAGAATAADRPAAAMPAFGAVGPVTATKTMALDNPFKAASLGNSNRVDEIALGKEGCADHVAGLYVPGKIAELFDALDGRGVVLL